MGTEVGTIEGTVEGKVDRTGVRPVGLKVGFPGDGLNVGFAVVGLAVGLAVGLEVVAEIIGLTIWLGKKVDLAVGLRVGEARILNVLLYWVEYDWLWSICNGSSDLCFKLLETLLAMFWSKFDETLIDSTFDNSNANKYIDAIFEIIICIIYHNQVFSS